MEFTELQSQSWVISIRDFWISYLWAKFCPSILWVLLSEKRTFADRTGCEEYCELDAVFFWIFFVILWAWWKLLLFWWKHGSDGLGRSGVALSGIRAASVAPWTRTPSTRAATSGNSRWRDHSSTFRRCLGRFSKRIIRLWKQRPLVTLICWEKQSEEIQYWRRVLASLDYAELADRNKADLWVKWRRQYEIRSF